MYNLNKINTTTYELSLFGSESEILMTTIQKLSHSCYHNKIDNKLIVNAENIISFKDYLSEKNNKLSYATCIKIIDSLTKHINSLHKLGYGYYGFDIEDILTIDDIFVFCNSEYLLPIERDSIIIYHPLNKPFFSSPEVIQLTKLPNKINYKCIYYSLASFIIFCLLETNLLVGSKEEDINNLLNPIHNTKLYWFIKRCLDNDINERQCLLI
jgi:hypothetical protein